MYTQATLQAGVRAQTLDTSPTAFMESFTPLSLYLCIHLGVRVPVVSQKLLVIFKQLRI